MKKRTVFLLGLISIILSACVYFSVPKEKIETSSVQTEESMSEMDQAFYAVVGNRAYREPPQDAAFGDFLAASFAKTQNDFSKSAVSYAKALEKDPESPDLLENTYLMYVLAGNVQEAVPFAAMAAEKNPQNILPKLVLFSDLILRKEYSLAHDLLNQQKENMGNEFFDVSLYPLLNAWVYVGENNQKKAILSLKPLLEVKGLESIYYLHEGLILDYFGENAKATAAYTKLEKSPEGQSLRSMMVMYDFYRRLNLLNQKEEFLKAYQTTQNSSFVSKDMMTNPKEKYRALSAADGISMVFFDIGSFVSQTENYETALYLIQLAIYLNPESSINKLFLGEVLEAMGQYQMANVVYRSFPKGKDLYRSMQLRLVLSLQKIGQLNEAKNELIHLIQEYPNIPLYYMTLGDVYRDMEEYQKSLKAYEKAFDTFQLKEDPQAAILYFNMAVCYEQLGDIEKTDELLQKAVSLDGKNPIYLNYLGYTWVERNKNLQQALQMIQDAVKQAPNDGNLLDSLGWAYYTIGDYEAALPVLEKAVEYEAGNAVINDHLGDVYWRLGRYRDARFQWEHARSLKQNNTEKRREQLSEKIEKGLPPIHK